MAIVKATYTRNKKAAKASVRYITHRPGENGKRTTREIYGLDGVLAKNDAYRMIDTARKGSVYFRIVISPDPAEEDKPRDLHLRQIAEATMLGMEKRLKKEVPFIAVDHTDHTANRHIHVIACVAGKLTPKDFQALRETATSTARDQRQERDLAIKARTQALEEAQWAY